MIMRIWSCEVRSREGDRYADYIKETRFTENGRTPGNRGAWLLRRDDGATGRTAFQTLSLWDSEEAIRAFAAPTSRRRCSTWRTRCSCSASRPSGTSQ